MASAEKPFTVDQPVGAERRERLDRTWYNPAGVIGWLSVVNHRSVGMRFTVTAFIFFLIAGAEALIMRVQLAQSNLDVLSPERYNQFFTMHGITMMFLVAIPAVEGVAMYLVPLMIGTRDMAFPRMGAFGYWVYLIAGITLMLGLIVGRAPDGGWFAYVPLTGPTYRPGVNLDLYALGVTFLEFSALTAAIEIIVTVFKQRAPGMSLNRMPIFVWAALVMAIMIVFAMPPLMVASLLLELDRGIGTHFYNNLAGGDHGLWQHLFWWFGHPEVYIILVPALGIVSSIIITFTRRPIFGYTTVVLATVATGFLSFGLWVHHMYTGGYPLLGMSFFAAASMMFAIPNGVQVFAWIATMWGAKIEFTTPMLYVIGFFVIFVLGGITGIMVASTPFDWQVHDSYFVVAHFHYVLLGGVIFPWLAGLHYWWPKFTGRMPSERLGKWSFWILLLGVNLTFFPMHFLGFWGMPRRYYTYRSDLGWDAVNLFVSASAFLMGLGFLIFAINLFWSYFWGNRASANPWNSHSLEWAMESPPPNYNFEVIPTVRGRYPLWEQHDVQAHPTVMVDPSRREVVGTNVLDADPDARVVVASPSIWPFYTACALAVAFLGMIVSVWVVPVGLLLTYVALVRWHWPTTTEKQT